MATKLRIEFHSAEFQRVLNSPGVRSKIESMTEAVRQAAGDGFESKVVQGTYGGSPRPIGIVRAATRDAKKAQAEDLVLTRALNAAGGS